MSTRKKTKSTTPVRQDSRGDRLRKLANEYFEDHGHEPVDLNDLFEWAEENQRWEPKRPSRRSLFKSEMRRALREELYTDPQGRRVRKKHPIVFKEGERVRSLWGDIINAKTEHMRLSLQQRRRQALGDVVQCKTDLDSFNDNNVHGGHIQMSFNFDECLEEMEQPVEYQQGPPLEEDD